jgi:hypothetical protein
MDNDKIKDKIYEKLPSKHNLPVYVIKAICESQFHFAYTTLAKVDFKKMTEQEILDMKTNFRWRGLGTLYVSERLLKGIKNKKKRTKDGDQD